MPAWGEERGTWQGSEMLRIFKLITSGPCALISVCKHPRNKCLVEELEGVSYISNIYITDIWFCAILRIPDCMQRWEYVQNGWHFLNTQIENVGWESKWQGDFYAEGIFQVRGEFKARGWSGVRWDHFGGGQPFYAVGQPRPTDSITQQTQSQQSLAVPIASWNMIIMMQVWLNVNISFAGCSNCLLNDENIGMTNYCEAGIYDTPDIWQNIISINYQNIGFWYFCLSKYFKTSTHFWTPLGSNPISAMQSITVAANTSYNICGLLLRIIMIMMSMVMIMMIRMSIWIWSYSQSLQCIPSPRRPHRLRRLARWLTLPRAGITNNHDNNDNNNNNNNQNNKIKIIII